MVAESQGLRRGFFSQKKQNARKTEVLRKDNRVALAPEPTVEPSTDQKENAQGTERPDDLLEELLRMPTAKFTEWALDQAQAVVGDGSAVSEEVENLEIWRYAEAFACASSEQKNALMSKGTEGFKGLPAKRKSEVFSFYLKHGDIMKVLLEAVKQRLQAREETSKASNSEPVSQENGDPSETDVDAACGFEEKSSAEVDVDAVRGSEDKASAVEDHSQSPAVEDAEQSLATEDAALSQVVENSVQPPAVEDAAMSYNLEDEDAVQIPSVEDAEKQQKKESLKRVAAAALGAWLEATSLVEPSTVLNAVTNLDVEERGQLAEVLVDTGVVPEESQLVLKEAVRVGGYVDRLSFGLRVASNVWQYLWLSYWVFFFEACFLKILGHPICDMPLQQWLFVDACLSACVVRCTFAAGRAIAPAMEAWQSDGLNKVLALRQAILETPSWEQRLNAAFPEVSYSVFRESFGWLMTVLMLITLNACWLPVGLYQWLSAHLMVCDRSVLWFSLIFLMLRSAIALSCILACSYLLWRLRRPQERGARGLKED